MKKIGSVIFFIMLFFSCKMDEVDELFEEITIQQRLQLFEESLNRTENRGIGNNFIQELQGKITDDIFEKTYLKSDGAFVYEDALDLVHKVKSKGLPLGLLTGNVKHGAQIKLGRFDLMKYFLFGVFGDDGETRHDLPLVARERAQEVLGKTYKFDEIILVGDTPEDAIAAKVNGCKSIIVCRRQEWYDDIVNAGADLVVESLDDPAIKI